MPPRIAFVTSHPIQYQVPVFRCLHHRDDVELIVFYAQIPDGPSQGKDFGISFSWDVPLLDGYNYEVLKNVAAHPSVTEFRGCDTPSIGEALRAHQCDVVICNGWVVKTCLQALRAAEKLKIPCLVRGEANDIRPRPWWKRAMQRYLVHRYRACLYIGEANRRFYLERGIPSERLFASPYCIDNERFEQFSRQRTTAEARETFGVPPHSTCFLFSGKFQTKKQPMELLQAFGAATRKRPDLHLLMVGDGELRRQCEAISRSDRIPVTFTGFLNQSAIGAAYLAADCLVLPSDYGETWGLVVNESMACGRPAIVSDQVGCREDLIVEGETGYSFPFGNWNALSDLFRSLDRNDFSRLGPAAKKRIEAYTPASAAEGLASGSLACLTSSAAPTAYN